MLADRDYMRESGGRAPLSLTARLTIVFVVIFAIQCIDDVYTKTGFEAYLALTPMALTSGWIWQLFTFQFLHLNLTHIIFNMIAFWWLGHFAERVLGNKKYLTLLIGCGFLGGLLQGFLMILFPGHYGFYVVGASAGVYGLLAMFALLERDSEIRFQFLLPMQAIVLLWISGGISLFYTLVPTHREFGVAHAAHLGGLLGGVAFVKLGWHRDFIPLPWENWRLRRRSEKRELVNAGSGRVSVRRVQPHLKPEELPPEEFISKEVDPILDKISQHGIHSLTDHERTVLEKARKKMSKR